MGNALLGANPASALGRSGPDRPSQAGPCRPESRSTRTRPWTLRQAARAFQVSLRVITWGSLSPARISGHCHRTSLSRVAGRGSPEPKCQPKSCLGIAEISPDRALSRVLVTVSRLRSGHCGRRLAAGAGTRLDPTHGHPTRSQPLV